MKQSLLPRYMIVISRAETRNSKSQNMLRHSLAYQLIKGGTPMTTIQQILGHESILTTNLYTQTTAQDKVNALIRLAW